MSHKDMAELLGQDPPPSFFEENFHFRFRIIERRPATSPIVEAMAKKAGVPAEVYSLLNAMESRAPHALDIASHIRLNPDKSLPALAERHLVPSTTTVLVALHIGTEAFKISGFSAEMEALVKRAERGLTLHGSGSTSV